MRATSATGRRCRGNGGRAGALLGGDCWVDDGRCGGSKSDRRARTVQYSTGGVRCVGRRERWRRGLENGRRWGSLRRHEGGCRARRRTTQGSAGRQQSGSQAALSQGWPRSEEHRRRAAATATMTATERQNSRGEGSGSRRGLSRSEVRWEWRKRSRSAQDGRLGRAHWVNSLADKL